MSTVYAVVGGQYGSEGKGAIAAHLCLMDPNIKTAIRVAGPNAGHSAIDPRGRKWALRQIPVAAVVRDDLRLVLAQGSEIDPLVLQHEIESLEGAGIPVQHRLWVDYGATVIEPQHIEAEGGYGGHLTERLGSTAKGVGAARADRIWRKARMWGDEISAGSGQTGWVGDTAPYLKRWLEAGESMLLEGTQGYGLGLHAGHYPQCTSSNCRAIDFLAMAAINPWDAEKVTPVVCLRTYPIRVAGNSGWMYDETTWEDLEKITLGYIKPEYTTVTKKMRRVGSWDADLAAAAIQANGCASVAALTFFDYWYPELAGVTDKGVLDSEQRKQIETVEAQIGCEILWLGTGPNSVINL